jgi:hypothetical protein
VSESKIRADLDAAIPAALPGSGGRVRIALLKLRKELADLDEQRAASAERLAAFHAQLRNSDPEQPAPDTGSSPSGGER